MSATRLVNSTIALNKEVVDAVASGARQDAFITATFPARTGIEAFRPDEFAQPHLRDTYGVGVLLFMTLVAQAGIELSQHIRETNEPTSTMIPPEFRQFARLFHEDVPWMYSDIEPVIRSGLRAVDGDGRKRLKSLIDDLASGRYAERELIDVWNQSGSDMYITKNILSFFKKVQHIMEEQ